MQVTSAQRSAEDLPVSATFCSTSTNVTAQLVDSLHVSDNDALPGTGLMNDRSLGPTTKTLQPVA